MKAEAQSFADIVRNSYSLVVPFFQRDYVWEEENWEALLEDLLSNNDHFIGSIIFKASPTEMGEMVWTIIDGQQRLTTLSVLFNVCYKVLSAAHVENQVFYEHERTALLFVFKQSKPVLKLEHSRVDRGAYEMAICGSHNYPIHSNRIIECADWFSARMKDNVTDAERIFNLLSGNGKILVNIQLGVSDREQAIFDTINTAGVRLTAADTIKNLLFQKMIDLAGSGGRSHVEDVYVKYWDMVFNSEEQDYWTKEHKQGRINRITLETMLHCVAVVERFYDPNRHSTGSLADCYKQYIADKSLEQLESFVRKIAKYAKHYKDFFWDEEDAGHVYEFGDVCDRTLNILRACDISTFDPLILKVVTDNPPSDDGIISPLLEKSLDEIARYVLLHTVCGESVKNFNKECSVVISGTKSIEEYTIEKILTGKLDQERVQLGLRCIKNNRVARCILFWLELKWRSMNKVDSAKWADTMSLEHLMPQKWKEFWPVENPMVVDPQTGFVVKESNLAQEIRTAAVYELGNMALLNQLLNSSVRNHSIKKKICGEGRKRLGIAELSDMHYTKEVVKKIQDQDYRWDEKAIRDRTNGLTHEFLSVWGMDEAALLAKKVVPTSSDVLKQTNSVSVRHGSANLPTGNQMQLSGQEPKDELKVGKIAQAVFPVLFMENGITDTDIVFLQSSKASVLFKTNNYRILKPTTGDISAEMRDGNGQPRFYANIILHHGGKQYLLTSQWRADGKANLMAWLSDHGISEERVVKLCQSVETK